MDNLITDMVSVILSLLSLHEKAQLARCSWRWAKTVAPLLDMALKQGLLEYGINGAESFRWNGEIYFGQVNRVFWRGEYTIGMANLRNTGYTKLQPEHSLRFFGRMPIRYEPHRVNHHTPGLLLDPFNRQKLHEGLFIKYFSQGTPTLLWSENLYDYVKDRGDIPPSILHQIKIFSFFVLGALPTLLVTDNEPALCDELWRVAELVRRFRDVGTLDSHVLTLFFLQ